MMPTLTLVPIGGMANRMRAILSALTLCEEQGRTLRVIWVRDAGLCARFSDLFLPISGVDIVELAEGLRSFLYQIPRKRNIYLPKLLQKLFYDEVLTENQLVGFLDAPKQINRMVEDKHALIITGLGFYPADDGRLSNLFQPIPELIRRIEKRVANLGRESMGVHIRRTDNKVSSSESPLESFVEAMRQNDAACYYVATDDENVKHFMRSEFPDRVQTSPFTASRSSVAGMQEALVEMLTLASTTAFVGSYYSSYSDTIIALRGNGIIIRKTKKS